MRSDSKLGKRNLKQWKKYSIVETKWNDVDFKRFEMDNSNTNDVQEDDDYVEMVQGDLKYISAQPDNRFSFLGGQ